MILHLKFRVATCPFCGVENVWYEDNTDHTCDHFSCCGDYGWVLFSELEDFFLADYKEKSVRYKVIKRKVDTDE